MKYLVKVKYFERHSEDGYHMARFTSYQQFTKWIIENHKKIVILEMAEE